ncbi:MAG TPA: hypothetical protein VFT82_00070 [Candidatus Paceibacterota bacterium]|nr:hypothetical protein [Candidatus Paceibacterota bacterium]
MKDADSKTTTDHSQIQRWVEIRGGSPAKVKGTESGDSALLRIEFRGGKKEDKLEKISWDDFFKIFEENGLTFLYQEKLKDGSESRFFKFISR